MTTHDDSTSSSPWLSEVLTTIRRSRDELAAQLDERRSKLDFYRRIVTRLDKLLFRLDGLLSGSAPPPSSDPPVGSDDDGDGDEHHSPFSPLPFHVRGMTIVDAEGNTIVDAEMHMGSRRAKRDDLRYLAWAALRMMQLDAKISKHEDELREADHKIDFYRAHLATANQRIERAHQALVGEPADG